MDNMFFQGWADVLRTFLVGGLAYAAMVAGLRASGKRTLAKLNAFDLVVTVALGSTLATILLSNAVALAEGIAAIATLILCQYVVAWASVRSRRVARLVRSEPTLLMRDGEICHEALRAARVTEAELRTILRIHGGHAVDEAAAVVLESDGSFSVIPKAPQGEASFARAGLDRGQGRGQGRG